MRLTGSRPNSAGQVAARATSASTHHRIADPFDHRDGLAAGMPIDGERLTAFERGGSLVDDDEVARPESHPRDFLRRRGRCAKSRVELGQRSADEPDVPLIPILQYEIHSVIAKRVGGLALSPTGTFDGAAVWLGK